MARRRRLRTVSESLRNVGALHENGTGGFRPKTGFGFGSDSFELSGPKDQFTDKSNSIEKLTSESSSVVFLRRASH